MRLLIELPLTIALFTLAVKSGWPYTVVFVLGYILAFNFKLPYLSRRAQISTRFLVFLGIFLAFAMTASMIIGRFFFSPNGQAWIEASRIWVFLLVTPALKVLWAAVIGFGLIALLAAVILIPYGQVAGQQMYSQYEQYKGHEGEAARTAINILLGISGGTWVISGGQAEVRGDPGGALTRFGGPGFLIVQEGHAVVLEVSGRISRVVGRGIWWLKPFERISMVVPLFLRSEKCTVEKVATRDKVLIDEFEVQVYHKADSGPADEQITDGQFAYSKQMLLGKIWSPGGGDWRNAVRSMADTATRDVVGQYKLEDIVPISATFRVDFRQRLIDEMNKVTRDKMGIVTVTVDIGKVKIPDEAENRLLRQWLADRDMQIALSEKSTSVTQAQADSERLQLSEATRADAQTRMMEAINDGFQKVRDSGGNPRDLIAIRFIEALEKMAEDPATKLIFPSDMKLADLVGLVGAPAGADKQIGRPNGPPSGASETAPNGG